MTVKELRKILKKCKYQDAEITIYSEFHDDLLEVKTISESHIIAEVTITVE